MAKPEKIRVSSAALHTLVESMFVKLGACAADAKTIAEVLVWANLRGVDSHGISRIPRYVELFESGEAKVRPNVVVAQPRASIVTIDADGAPGPVAMSRAVREAIATARNTGIAWAAVRGTVHTGAIGYYTSQVAAAGMAGIGIVAGVPNMAYTGARGAAVATSPLSIAVPSSSYGEVVLDMATAVIALGRIAQLRAGGTPLPEGAAVTAKGEPTTDPNLAEIPLPMAGAKGAGLSLMIELLTGVLVGNPVVSRFHSGSEDGKRHRQNGTIIAIEVEAFMPLAEFKSSVDATLGTLKGLSRAVESVPILFPGERGARVYREREAGGIPIAVGAWQKLGKDAAKLGVPLPEPLPPAA
jgi:LDH2 family malate/lactate/ureidoglycolate dehydrogenase